jgi:hypothetical protein
MAGTTGAAAPLPAPLQSFSRLAGTAVHEAGHAVTAFGVRRKLTRVTIKPDDEVGAGGICSTATPGAWFRPDIEVTRRTRSFVEDQVLISLAGTATEEAWLATLEDRPKTWRRQLQIGARPDRRAVALLAEYVTGSDAEARAYVGWLTERCRSQMNPLYWRMVGGLAVELLERGSLSGRAATDVIRAAAFARG